MNLGTKGFNPRIRPKTKSQEEVINILKSPVEQYIESTARDFDDKGEYTESYFQGYCQFSAAHSSSKLNFNYIGPKSKTYLIKKRVRINGELKDRYFLIGDYKQKIVNNNIVDIDFDTTDNIPI